MNNKIIKLGSDFIVSGNGIPMSDEELVKKYIDEGVHPSKIVVTSQPSICLWSLSRNCLVGENGVGDFELVSDGNGTNILSYDNNVRVSLQIRTELDVNKINNSQGIIVTVATYGAPHFRFGFIPTPKNKRLGKDK